MNKQNRKSTFKEDILSAQRRIPGGSNRYRHYLESTAISIMNDLSSIGALPSRFKNLKAEAIVKLIAYWQNKHYQVKTIKNKLAVLRSLILAGQTPIQIPSNQSLKLKENPRKPLALSVKIIDPKEINCPPVQNILLLQYHFGLKKYEALKFNNAMIRKTTLEIPRSISYNKKDRSIPIVTTEQSQLVEILRQQQTKLFYDRKFIRALALIHASTLKEHHIKHPEYFRHLYILNRYQALIFIGISPIKATRKVADETGYYHLTQIKEILENV